MTAHSFLSARLRTPKMHTTCALHTTRVYGKKKKKKKKEERRKDPLVIPLRLTRTPRRTFESHCLPPTDVKQRFLFYCPLKCLRKSVYFIEFHELRKERCSIDDEVYEYSRRFQIFLTGAICSLNVRSLTYFSGRLYTHRIMEIMTLLKII